MAQNLLHHGFSAWMKPHWPAISDVHHWGLHGFSSAAMCVLILEGPPASSAPRMLKESQLNEPSEPSELSELNESQLP